jgi:polysaccharide deacetylase family protein (PEP-CTERM system associated)
MKNILTIDLEDYFHANNVATMLRPGQRETIALRIEEPTRVLLKFLKDHEIEATFFVLGEIAEKLPDLVRDIERQGHEIATHGYSHTLLTRLTPESFEHDLRRALAVTQPCARQKIAGFRAPSFTIVKSTRWAIDVLEKLGFSYDSSVFPVGFHPDYGMPGATTQIGPISPRLTEIPISCVDIAGIRFPCTGGGYFRLFPYFWSRLLYRTRNRRGQPFVFYLHPWEIDAGQPRFAMPLTKKIRHYVNIDRMMNRLEKLVGEFQFTSIRSILAA